MYIASACIKLAELFVAQLFFSPPVELGVISTHKCANKDEVIDTISIASFFILSTPLLL